MTKKKSKLEQPPKEKTAPDVIAQPPTENRAEALAAEHGIDFKQLISRMPVHATVTEVLDELGRLDPVIWTMLNRRLKRVPMTFDMSKYLKDPALRYDTKTLLRHRPFLVQPLRDQHKHKVYEKSRQMGISELSITEVAYFLDITPQKKWLYTFPRDTQLKDFSNTRIAAMFEETPRIARLLTGTNQTYAKMIGDNSWLLLRSAWESNLGEGIDADGVTLDEKDRMKDGVENAFTESLSSSAYGFLREVSTPTLPGRGVDAVWRKSDQWIWHVRCERCGLEQPIEYPENVLQMKDISLGAKELPAGAYEYACRKASCHGPLNRMKGRWICTRPEVQKIRGYHITQLMAPWISATEVMQKKIDSKFIQLWENYVLGRVSKGDSILVTDVDFMNSTSNYSLISGRTPAWSRISVGIDWGGTNWFVVLGKNAHNNRNYLLNIGIIEDDAADALNMSDVIQFIAPYDPDIIVADAGYGKDRNAKLLRHFDPNMQGKFYACNYNAQSRASRTFVPVFGEARVVVDRTITLKSMCRAIKEHEIGFPAGDAKAELLKSHVKALAPLKQEEEGELFETIEATGDDHLAHALGYAWLGLEKTTSEGKFSFDFV